MWNRTVKNAYISVRGHYKLLIILAIIQTFTLAHSCNMERSDRSHLIASYLYISSWYRVVYSSLYLGKETSWINHSSNQKHLSTTLLRDMTSQSRTQIISPVSSSRNDAYTSQGYTAITANSLKRMIFFSVCTYLCKRCTWDRFAEIPDIAVLDKV